MIVGICGPIGSGKSTLATMLLTELTARGQTAYIRSMAAVLKDITARLKPRWNIIENYHILYSEFIRLAPFNSPRLARKAALWTVYYHVRYFTPNEKPRKFLQRLGTEVGRDILGYDTWIRAFKQYAYLQGKSKVAIVDDIRFDNEAVICDVLIKIDVNQDITRYQQNIAATSKDYVAPHASERGIAIDPHYILKPGFTIEDVERLADYIIGSK